MISGGEIDGLGPLPNANQAQCENGYFPNEADEPLAKKCAQEKTNKSPKTPHIALPAESGSGYYVVEGGPIVKMWHILDGLAARNNPRVTASVDEYGEVTYSIAPEYPPTTAEYDITSLEFKHIPDLNGYNQYLAMVRKANSPYYADYYWRSDELGCFSFGDSGHIYEEKTVIAAMRTFGVCPNVQLPIHWGWQEILHWVFSENDGLLKFVQETSF